MISEKVREALPTYTGLSLLIKYFMETTKEDDLALLITMAAQEFEFELKNFKMSTMSKMNNHILKNGKHQESIIISPEEEPILEITESGIITLLHSWNRFYYEGTVLNDRKTTILRINNLDHASMYLTEKEENKLKESIVTLYDTKETKRRTAREKVGAIYEIFKSPRMNNEVKGMATLMNVVSSMRDDYGSMSGKDQRREKEKLCNKVIGYYLDYLWEKQRKKTDPQYILTFESFIERNRDAWSKGRDAPEESLNLYTEDHNSLVRMFNELKEPKSVYGCERRNLCNNVWPQETMRSGLVGM